MAYNNYLYYFIIIFLKIISFSYSQKTEYDAQLYIQNINYRMFAYYDELNYLTRNKSPEELSADRNVLNLTTIIAQLSINAQQYSNRYYANDKLSIELDNIKKVSSFILLKTDMRIYKCIEKMQSAANEKDLCDYENKILCNKGYKANVINIIKNNNNDSKLLKHYWIEYRKSAKIKSFNEFLKYLDYINAASKIAKTSPIEFWYQEYNGDSNLIWDMEKVINDTRPFFIQLHSVLRYQLNQKYGDDIIQLKGLIPHHILETLLYQSETKISDYLSWYPSTKHELFEKPLDYYGRSKHKIFTNADEFYSNMGLAKLIDNELFVTKQTITLPNGHTILKERAKSDGQFFGQLRGVEFIPNKNLNCIPKTIDKTPNVTMEYCSLNNFEQMMYTYRDWAKVQWADQKYQYGGLRYAFWHSYNFQDAFGEAVILSASTLKYLSEQKDGETIVPDFMYKEQHQMNRIYRMAIHTMLHMRILFVHAKLMNDLLTHKISTKQINRHYWKLMEEHLGVEPPIDRMVDDIDMPYSFYEDIIENEITKKFFTEVLGYQFYHKLCEIRGEYNGEVRDSFLYECSFSSSNELYMDTGDKLKSFMKLGSSYNWKKTLGYLTGNLNGLQANGILKYFEPLRLWLEDEFNKNKLYFDWSSPRRHVI